MTVEELEKLKKGHDYCIIPVENILGIEDIRPIQGYDGIATIHIKMNKDDTYMQFVDSFYFRTWRTKLEETNDKVVNALLGEVREINGEEEA